ncbi:MAG: RNase adapter RapZ [Clostridia bacterium]|nr:RNase adapter RapZ [Clostridia bacterium]
MKYLIVTGLSGAGKTACVRYLEDKGSFCMDNIPPMMLPKLLEAFDSNQTRWQTVTIAVDARSGEFFDAHAVAQMIRELSRIGHSMETIFMEASDETLLARYKETRRDHPLSKEGLTLVEAIAEERLRLQPLRETADYIIDTSGLTTREMKKKLNAALGSMSDAEPPIRAEVMSFGFKRGLPRQADLVIDVRFLPNPFYIESMCRHTGLDPDVKEFVTEHPVTKAFMEKWTDLLSFLIPCYREEGKHRLVIAVGCTGGVHRSVTIAEAIGAYLREQGLPTEITHRDLLLEQARWNVPLEDGE